MKSEKEISAEEKKESLLKDWIKFKKAENTAKDARYKVETQIEELYGSFDGGSKTFKEDKFKVSIKKSLTMKLDQDEYKKVRKDIPEELRPEKIKFELDNEGFKYLKENKPEIYKLVSDCVTLTPGKSTITVEKVK
jgi:hypothetical protein